MGTTTEVELPSALEKARQDPESMKARILTVARRIFAQYGYHGATTRAIAREVGIDISTLYYHWGEKEDLYEAVIFDMAEDLRQKLREVEKIIHGCPLSQRLDVSIDIMTDWLFDHPEISNLVLLRYFSKTRQEMKWDARVPEFISDIAGSMGLADKNGFASVRSRIRVLALMNAIHNFISGEEFFCSMLALARDEYIPLAKETLKFMFIPAFTGKGPIEPQGDPAGLKNVNDLS
jgi:TetR/AcrR family transcriptional regulator, regulator of cefoperazone and chloramphenicol sensitivity